MINRSTSGAARLNARIEASWLELIRHRAAERALFATARQLFQEHLVAVGIPAETTAPAGRPKQLAATVRTYSGTNHFWIPELGVSRPVHLFACTRTREPDNFIYRWGCAGRNNVYILGHASTVLKPLHDAYNAGRLHVGMIALYADGAGHVRAYRVTEWRVVNPVDSAWAIASQPVPSMTLQTCVGPKGVDRLNVRLVAID